MFQEDIPRTGAAPRCDTGSKHATLHYVLDAKKQLVVVKFRETITVRDIESYAAALRAHPQFKPDFSEIADLSAVKELDLQADEFIRLADEIDPFSPQARRAFVARSKVQHHAARMHKILGAQKTFSIFTSVEEAERWIFS